MKKVVDFLEFWQEWHGTWRFLASVGIALILIWLAKSVLFQLLRKAVKRTESLVDDQILEALQVPARYWAVLAALVAALRGLDERDLPLSVQRGLSNFIVILLVISFTLAVSRVSEILLAHSLVKQGSNQQVTTLTRTVIRFLWSVPGFLIILNLFGISLAPALTAVGVGGLAISLAMKDTLANLFSGFYVSLAGNIHKGDYIKLDEGQEGYVEDIRWRITTLRTLQNNIVVIPNSKLSEAVVTNYSFPNRRMAVQIPIGVGYNSDIDRVDRVLVEVARACAAEVDGLLEDPAPVVRFSPGFGESSLNFTLVVHVSDYEKQFGIQDVLRRRIFLRFKEEGISIPFPVRTLDLAPGSLKRALENPGAGS